MLRFGLPPGTGDPPPLGIRPPGTGDPPPFTMGPPGTGDPPPFVILSYVDATDKRVESYALERVQHLEELKSQQGPGLLAEAAVDRSDGPPYESLGVRLLIYGVPAVGAVAGIAGAFAGSMVVLAAAPLLGAGVGLSTHFIHRATHEPGWGGQRIFRIERDKTGLIDSPVVAEKPQANGLQEFLSTRLPGYPTGRTVVHAAGHGLGYRKVAGRTADDFADALRQATEKSGHPIDVLFLETCLAGNLETLAATYPYARYAVVSAEAMSSDVAGDLLKGMVGAQPATSEAMARALVDEASRLKTAGNPDFDIQAGPKVQTLAMVDMARIPEVLKAVDTLGGLLADEIVAGRRDAVDRAVQATPRYARRDKVYQEKLQLGDLNSFARLIGESYATSNSPRQKSILDAAQAVQKSLEAALPARHASSDYSAAGTLSIQLPSKQIALYEGSESFKANHYTRFQDSAAPANWKRFVEAWLA